jgi:DNA repair protein RadC
MLLIGLTCKRWLILPYPADLHLTQSLKAALALVDVRVLDHVIVGPGQAFSMAEQGVL